MRAAEQLPLPPASRKDPAAGRFRWSACRHGRARRPPCGCRGWPEASSPHNCAEADGATERPTNPGISGGGGASMLIENVFEPGPCHRGAFGVDEDLWDTGGSVPASHARSSVAVSFQSGRDRSLRPFPRTRMLGGRWRETCSSWKPHQFGDTHPAGETKMQHGAISNTEARRQIRGVEDCPHLDHREVSHQLPGHGAFVGSAWICLICSSADGTRNSTYRMKALIAASRELRVVASLCAVARCGSGSSSTRAASMCSRQS